MSISESQQFEFIQLEDEQLEPPCKTCIIPITIVPTAEINETTIADILMGSIILI